MPKKKSFKELYERLEKISNEIENLDLDVEKGSKLVIEAKEIKKQLDKIIKSATKT